jgi:hypothetical protein
MSFLHLSNIQQTGSEHGLFCCARKRGWGTRRTLPLSQIVVKTQTKWNSSVVVAPVLQLTRRQPRSRTKTASTAIIAVLGILGSNLNTIFTSISSALSPWIKARTRLARAPGGHHAPAALTDVYSNRGHSDRENSSYGTESCSPCSRCHRLGLIGATKPCSVVQRSRA